MTERTFILGTRKSPLALWQANYVGQLLKDRFPDLRYQLETFLTTGDRMLNQPLPEIGGKGLFTQELEIALHNKTIDLVVHSLKDLPVEGTPGLVIAAIPARENPRDVLISAHNVTLETLPEGARVGTSSLRRMAQLLNARPDLTFLPLRGNIDTRIRKTMEGDYDAIILAAAGVYRLGLTDAVRQELSLDHMLPAPGQGALAVQGRASDNRLRDLLIAIDQPEVRQAVTAERAFLAGLGGGCAAPVAAFSEVQDDKINLTGMVASIDGRETIRVRGACSISDEGAVLLGKELARQAFEQGANALMQTQGKQ